MAKRIFLFLTFFLVPRLCLAASGVPVSVQETGQVQQLGPIKKSDRILILAPHPDDEAIACAGVIQEALAKGAKVEIIYLTNGDHNEAAFIVYEKRITFLRSDFIHMGQVRRQEAIKAMKILGLEEKNLVFLGYPDFGTFNIFSQYWQTKAPFEDILTRISSVPYKEDFSFGASYVGENILNDLKRLILEYKPNKIFVSHPADINVDHKAFYLFLQIALRDLSEVFPEPEIYPYLVHSTGWPLPRHYHPELELSPPNQLLNTGINWQQLRLAHQRVDRKYRAILCYRSQTNSAAFYLLAFARKNELFGDYPKVVLEKQTSIREQASSFFGFTEMFPEENRGVLEGLDHTPQYTSNVSYAVVDNALLIKIKRPKEVMQRYNFQTYLFGWRPDVPFAAMPKICIFAQHQELKVLDKKKAIPEDSLAISLNFDELILKVPLQVLRNPEFILSAIKAHSGVLPFDVMGFRRVEIEEKQSSQFAP